ncbi:protein FAM178B [Eublepharis macularius]|uniref:Protein FAM178B n=1 Tax=Eublepharis macularius TaxID=481883 RepID=A0AA97LFF1_EUBMA|nr:protein FAM178B [Eublepharis macularius]
MVADPMEAETLADLEDPGSSAYQGLSGATQPAMAAELEAQVSFKQKTGPESRPHIAPRTPGADKAKNPAPLLSYGAYQLSLSDKNEQWLATELSGHLYERFALSAQLCVYSSQFAQQMALLHNGFLIFLYCGGQSRCPHPVQRWLFQFLTLCVASHPHGYPDRQRMALLALLCRLSLDRNLQKQSLLELQQLLLVLLEGIQDWQAKLLELCKSLCHVSQHHHNLVTVMHLFPDTTDRGRRLRRNLSLCFIIKLLGKMNMATSPWQEEIQLQQLGHLLPLMKPTFLKQGLQKLPKHQDGKEQQEALAELDQEACYLCYSLLILANVVVGTQAMPSSNQGPLQHLCAQLQQHISASIREDPSIMYRTELKNLVAQTYVKWQELLSRRWLQGQS